MLQVYSLIGGFCGSPVNFHAKDGSGYKFLGELVVQLDKINPQVSTNSKSNLASIYIFILNHIVDLPFFFFDLVHPVHEILGGIANGISLLEVETLR